MNKRSANLSVVAARAAQQGRSTRNVGTPAVDVASRLTPLKAPVGPIRRARHYSGATAQRDSMGRLSAWGRSAELGGSLGVTVRESRWSQTVQNRAV